MRCNYSTVCVEHRAPVVPSLRQFYWTHIRCEAALVLRATLSKYSSSHPAPPESSLPPSHIQEHRVLAIRFPSQLLQTSGWRMYECTLKHLNTEFKESCTSTLEERISEMERKSSIAMNVATAEI